MDTAAYERGLQAIRHMRNLFVLVARNNLLPSELWRYIATEHVLGVPLDNNENIMELLLMTYPEETIVF